MRECVKREWTDSGLLGRAWGFLGRSPLPLWNSVCVLLVCVCLVYDDVVLTVTHSMCDCEHTVLCVARGCEGVSILDTKPRRHTRDQSTDDSHRLPPMKTPGSPGNFSQLRDKFSRSDSLKDKRVDGWGVTAGERQR